MRKFLLLAAVTIACSSMAVAQSADYNKVELFGGYSYARVDNGIIDSRPGLAGLVKERDGFNGFNASVTGNLSRYFGLTFDVSGHFKNGTQTFRGANFDVDSNLFSFLGGVQVKDNSTETTLKPFAHALVGAARARNKADFSDSFCAAIFPSPCPQSFNETDTGLAGAFGGGLDIRAGKRFDIRAVQVDYTPTRVFNATQNNFRVGVGIVIH